MKHTDVQNLANNLTTLISKTQDTIKEQHDTLASLIVQINNQENDIQKLSSQNKEIESMVIEYQESVSKHIENLTSKYEAFLEEQNKYTLNLSDKTDLFEGTLSSLNDCVLSLGNDLESISKDMTTRVVAFANQVNSSYEIWKNNSDSLISDLSAKLLELDKKISITLDAAAQTITKNLEHSLCDLSNALSLTNLRMKRLFIINIILIIITIIAIALTIVL